MSDVLIFASQVATLAVGAVTSVMVLTLFFKWLPRVSPKAKQITLSSADDLFGKGRHYDVTLSSGQRFTALRFEGVVNADVETGWSLRQLAVFHRADGGKVILRIENLRAFEEVVRAQ